MDGRNVFTRPNASAPNVEVDDYRVAVVGLTAHFGGERLGDDASDQDRRIERFFGPF